MISSNGMIKGYLEVFEIFSSEILFVRKFGKCFLGWLDIGRDFFGHSKQSKDLW